MTCLANALDPASFQYISELVLKRSAIVLEPVKAYLVESRLTPLARQQGFNSIAELVAALREARRRFATTRDRGDDHQRDQLLSRHPSVRNAQGGRVATIDRRA